MADIEDWEILSDNSNINWVESQPCLIVQTDTNCPLECSDTVTLECSESYSSMPPLMDSVSILDLSHDGLETVQDSVESCPDPMITIREYIAAITLLQLRETCPSKKVTKRNVHHTIPNRPMTRSYAKKLNESMIPEHTVHTRPMTRLYKKQLGL